MWYLAGIPIVERNHAMVVNTFLWTILALIVMMARFYTRAVLVKRIGWDDWLMLSAMVTSILFLISIVFQIKYGLGLPVDLATLTGFLASLYATIPLYNLTQTLYKLSITLQSYRLFSTQNGKKMIKALMAWILICGLFTVLASLFYCKPISKAWNVFSDGKCIGNAPLNFTISSFNILNDLFLLAIPMFFLRNLQINEKQRVILMSIFACGFLISIVSIIRLKALYDNVKGPAENQPVSGVDIALWSGLEINIAIICGSVPALKAFVSQVILRRIDSQPSGYGNSSAARKQSRVLASMSGDDDYRMDKMDRENGLKATRLQINVRNSIEMNRGDDGSESDLIIQGSGNGSTQNLDRGHLGFVTQKPGSVHISSVKGGRRQSVGV